MQQISYSNTCVLTLKKLSFLQIFQRTLADVLFSCSPEQHRHVPTVEEHCPQEQIPVGVRWLCCNHGQLALHCQLCYKN
jgi:hypothetical protein